MVWKPNTFLCVPAWPWALSAIYRSCWTTNIPNVYVIGSETQNPFLLPKATQLGRLVQRLISHSTRDFQNRVRYQMLLQCIIGSVERRRHVTSYCWILSRICSSEGGREGISEPMPVSVMETETYILPESRAISCGAAFHWTSKGWWWKSFWWHQNYNASAPLKWHLFLFLLSLGCQLWKKKNLIPDSKMCGKPKHHCANMCFC